MPLDEAVTDRVGAIKDTFGEIGRVNGTAMPRSRKPDEKVAWEYWVASVLAQLAEARRNKAKVDAVAAGVLPDHVASPMAVGTSETVYTGDLVTIGVKVVQQADRVNVPALVADLEKAGVKATVLKRLVKKHTTTFAGAHIFTASLVTG